MAEKFIVTPVYNEDMEQIQTTDPVHASVVNPRYSQLLNNDAYLKQEVDGIKDKFQKRGITWNELRGRG